MKREKQKKAAALKYDSIKDNAPKITAKGTGLVAERIIELAAKEGIPVTEDPDLATALIQLDFHEEIPPEMYTAVAEILAFTYGLNRRMASKE
ncbi:EscU/YscU/HrcU family type III secretion system export apparatus switch protein [Thermodesulfobacteriota bacterium]